MAQIELHDGKDLVLLRNYDCGWELCWERNTYPDPKDKTIIEKVWVACKWYPSLLGVMNSIAEMKIRNSDAGSIQDLIKVIHQIREELKGVYHANIV